MPAYEAALILRNLARPQMLQAIKRSSDAIMDRGGIIRSFDNLGSRRLPYDMHKHGVRHKEGQYFLVHFDSPNAILLGLRDQLDLDVDIIRPRILRKEEEIARPCEYMQCDFGELDDDKRNRAKFFQKRLIRKK